MGYSIAYNSGSTVPFGTYKQGNILMGLKPQEYTVSSGFTWYANAETPNDNYLIISDTYSQGWSTQAESKPTIWRSETGTTESFVSLVNQLPDVNGVTGFTDGGEAMKYLMDSGKYFVNKDDYLGIVTDGLVLNLDAGWHPSYSGSGTTWKDLKNTNNGTLINGVTFNSDNGGVLSFDGTDDYCQVEHSDSLYITTSYSVEFWFRTVGSTASDNKVLWEKGVNKSVIQTYGPGTFYLHYRQASSAVNVELMDGNWKHVFTTWDKPNQIGYFYLNGVLKSSGPLGTSGNFPNTDFMQIMGRTPQGVGFLDGEIAIWRMYNKYFTQQEILQNYNTTKGRFGL